MKYCKICSRLYPDSVSVCDRCRKSLGKIEDKNTPVFLVSASALETERIRAALSESGIPSDTRSNDTRVKPEIMYGSKGQSDILVPVSAYNEAFDICVGIGSAEPGDRVPVEAYEASAPAAGGASDESREEEEEMSPAKRTTVKILSAILFIIIAALVIFGTDYITGLIKGLFG